MNDKVLRAISQSARLYTVMEGQTPNINVVHSVWRRLKKAKIRDLQPLKDVKGGGGVAGKSEPTRCGTHAAGTTGKHR